MPGTIRHNYSKNQNLKNYKHIFFDLDRTLWDFERNSSLTLLEILEHHNLKDKITDTGLFVQTYHKYNDYVWDLYKKKKIRKQELRTERFRLLLNNFGIHDINLAQSIDKYYIENAPKKPLVIHPAHQVLDYLYKKYQLYIISNGFWEVQETKLKSSNIRRYFIKIYTSDKIGTSKPDKRFFEYAVKSANARKSESLVIGDDIENDISGARNFGIDQVWYNPSELKTELNPTFTIRHLDELLDIL